MATLKELYDQGHRNVWRPTTGRTAKFSSIDFYNPNLSAFDAICDDWEPVIEKKKKSVVLYRATIMSGTGEIFQTNWSTQHDTFIVGGSVLKTETKTLEWEE